MSLLNAGRLFQTLLEDASDVAEVAADLDVDSFDEVPFVTHSELIAQDGNANGLWTVTLTVNIFVDAARNPHETVSAIYDLIRSWGEHPTAGVVPGVGGVENVEDLQAFTPLPGAAQMLNKVVRQYNGSFSIGVRHH